MQEPLLQNLENGWNFTDLMLAFVSKAMCHAQAVHKHVLD
jgi:hypothetical protein